MPKSLVSLPTLSLLVLLCFFYSDGILRLANGQATGQGSWCVAKPSSSEQELLANIEFACNYVNCNVIQPGGPCYAPNNRINHASVAMNLYYQKMGKNYWNCDFRKTAILTVSDPSYADCKYAFDK